MPDNHSLPVLPDPDRLSRILARAEKGSEKGSEVRVQGSEETSALNPEPRTLNPPPNPEPRTLNPSLRAKVIALLKTIYDPEIPVNIYELGLVYEVTIRPDNSVYVRMTLTAPACPVAETLPIEVESKIQSIPEVASAEVELVWDPPWTRERMSEAAMLTLGL